MAITSSGDDENEQIVGVVGASSGAVTPRSSMCGQAAKRGRGGGSERKATRKGANRRGTRLCYFFFSIHARVVFNVFANPALRSSSLHAVVAALAVTILIRSRGLQDTCLSSIDPAAPTTSSRIATPSKPSLGFFFIKL